MAPTVAASKFIRMVSRNLMSKAQTRSKTLIENNFNYSDFLFPGLLLTEPVNASRFSTEEASSIYIEQPSPAVDAAWDELSLETLEMTTISRSQFFQLGHDLRLLARVPESWGLGADRYFAQIQVFHLIHCLDEVRKQMNYDYYYAKQYGELGPPPEFLAHKNHCLHMLLENLLCQSSSGVITHNWRETYHVPLADWKSPTRTCRNFDTLWDWVRSHAVPEYRETWGLLEVPSDAVVLPAPTPRIY
jgi:hypothetical protein